MLLHENILQEDQTVDFTFFPLGVLSHCQYFSFLFFRQALLTWQVKGSEVFLFGSCFQSSLAVKLCTVMAIL